MAKSPYTELRNKIVLEHLEKFQGVPSRSIARIIYRDNPLLFKHEEDARGLVRLYRGQCGARNRKFTKLKKYYEKLA